MWVRVPFYSISLAASIEVELELQKKGWKRQEVRAGSHWQEPGGLRVILEHADGRTVGAFGLENEALCRGPQGGFTLGRGRRIAPRVRGGRLRVGTVTIC
jgi:hypothetical protein